MSSGGDPNSGLINNNEQLRLVNQLLNRKICNLQTENQGLRERICSLTTDDDRNRIRLIVADSERRQLVKLRALVKHHVSVLTSSIREFNAFVDDIDQGIDELAKEGAMDPDTIGGKRVTIELNKVMQRITESPLVGHGEKSAADDVAASSLKQEPSFDAAQKRKDAKKSSSAAPPAAIHKSPPMKVLRASKKPKADKSADTAAPVKTSTPAAAVVAEPTNENWKTAGAAECSTLCFEDALSYTIVGDVHATVQSPQLFSVAPPAAGAVPPPFFTSTPKLPHIKASRDREGLVPQAIRRHPKQAAIAVKTSANIAAKSRKRNVPKKKVAAVDAAAPTPTPTNRSEGDSGFILDPLATVNVTARRRTSCSHAEVDDEENGDNEDQTTEVAGDVTVVDAAAKHAEPDDDVTIVPTQPPSAATARKRSKRKSDSDDHNDSTFALPVAAASKRRRAAHRVRQATPMLAGPSSAATASDPLTPDASIASTFVLANMTSETTRQKRAAALKVDNYRLPQLNSKLRRE